jgi:cytochrome c oxidase cbb3-type subunit III
MKRVSAVLVGIIAGMGFGVTDARAQDLPEGVTEEMIEQGQAVYMGAGLCMACHGPDAKGLIGPDLTDEEWLQGAGTYEQIIEVVTLGVAADKITNPLGVVMPPKGGSAITEEQIRQVSAYVWGLTKNNGG